MIKYTNNLTNHSKKINISIMMYLFFTYFYLFFTYFLLIFTVLSKLTLNTFTFEKKIQTTKVDFPQQICLQW